MFKHILLPTDGSDLSTRAVKLGIELAQACHARVYALHVVSPYHTVSYMAEMLAATEATYMQEATARAERYLAQVQHAAKVANVEYDGSHVLNDHPHEAIIETVDKQHCDLVVMASHGRRGLKRVLLGSETQHVLTHSSIPVLVLR